MPLTKGYYNERYSDTTPKTVEIPATIIPPGEQEEYIVTKIDSAFLHTAVSDDYIPESPVSKVIIPETVEEIGRAFHECNKLKEINLNNVKKLSDIGISFRNCKNLESFSVNEDNPAFTTKDGMLFTKDGEILLRVPDGKSNVSTKLDIPEGTTTIGKNACSYMEFEELVLPATLVNIEPYAFFNNLKLSKITFNNGLKRIGENAFHLCPISNLILPDSLEIIEKQTFLNVNNKTVIIPSSVKQIEDAFNRATSLIFVGSTPPEAHKDILNFSRFEGILYVPEDALQAYKEHSFWSLYPQIIGYADLDVLLMELTIKTISEDKEALRVFDLHGHQLHQIPDKGFYIQNGRILFSIP